MLVGFGRIRGGNCEWLLVAPRLFFCPGASVSNMCRDPTLGCCCDRSRPCCLSSGTCLAAVFRTFISRLGAPKTMHKALRSVSEASQPGPAKSSLLMVFFADGRH
jgi:hypothetical protein